jgi:hypothetical protein
MWNRPNGHCVAAVEMARHARIVTALRALTSSGIETQIRFIMRSFA